LLPRQTVDGLPAAVPPIPGIYATEPWEDPQVTSINRQPARATAYSFTSAEESAVGRSRQKRPHVIPQRRLGFSFSLNLPTHPQIFINQSQRLEKDYRPSSWEMQGYDIPIYKSAVYPFSPYRSPRWPKDYNAVGSYQPAFPSRRLEGMTITLHFAV